MNENNLSPIEIYINRIFRFFIVIIPSVALCAGLTFTMLHLMGYYPTVRITTMVIFDVSCTIYTIVGFIFNRRCEDNNGRIKPGFLEKGKIFIALMEIIQWNFITYMIPSRDFWAYSFFFVLLAVCFLDSKFILIIIAEITVSMLLSWVIRPDLLLPIRDVYFVPEMVLRCVLIVLCFVTIWIFVHTIEHSLAKELEKVSDYDTLTLLYNRRKLEKYLNNAMAQRYTGRQFSVIMSDIDDFKKVNDTYGHSCGDEVLRDVASIMRNDVGNNGLVFRYGGEEMLVLLYAGEEETISLAEKIRKNVENHLTLYEDKSIQITLTFGLAMLSETDTRETLIKRADANLYYGKSHGKNCVIR